MIALLIVMLVEVTFSLNVDPDLIFKLVKAELLPTAAVNVAVEFVEIFKVSSDTIPPTLIVFDVPSTPKFKVCELPVTAPKVMLPVDVPPTVELPINIRPVSESPSVIVPVPL